MNTKTKSVFDADVTEVHEDIKYYEMLEDGRSDFVKGIEYIFEQQRGVQ